MAMKTDAAGQAFICGREGLKLKAYQDDRGVWTIGNGLTHHIDGTPVKEGETCSPEEARSWFLVQLTQREADVNRLVSVPLTQPQFNALVSFDFNEGAGNLAGSTLLKLVNSGRYRDAAAQFCLWDKVRQGGKLVYNAGLARRRAMERDLFLSGTAQPLSASPA